MLKEKKKIVVASALPVKIEACVGRKSQFVLKLAVESFIYPSVFCHFLSCTQGCGDVVALPSYLRVKAVLQAYSMEKSLVYHKVCIFSAPISRSTPWLYLCVPKKPHIVQLSKNIHMSNLGWYLSKFQAKMVLWLLVHIAPSKAKLLG